MTSLYNVNLQLLVSVQILLTITYIKIISSWIILTDEYQIAGTIS